MITLHNPIKAFADFCATQTGEFSEVPCKCPMALYAMSLDPKTNRASAGEYTVGAYNEQGRMLVDIIFPYRFFSTFIENAGTWEELTRRLRRAE